MEQAYTYEQAEFESKFCQSAVHDMLREAILVKFNDELSYWVMGSILRINEYLDGSYYSSKAFRVAETRERLDKKGIDWLLSHVLLAVIKAKRDQTLQQVVGYLSKCFNHDDKFDCMKSAGEILSLCCREGGIFELIRTDKNDTPMVQVNHWDIINQLFETEFEWIMDTHSNPPLIERPLKVINNHCAGYHTVDEPLVLGKFTRHDDNLSYDVINRLNQIPWLLDSHIRTIGERPPKDFEEYDQWQNWRNHCREAERIYDELEGNPFYLVWQFDSRGRLYSHGHHVQFQSYEYKKALLSVDYFAPVTTEI